MSVLYMATQIMQCKRFSSLHHRNRVHRHRLLEGRETISRENRRRTVASWRTSFLKAAINAPRALSRTLPSRHVGNIVMPCLLCTLDEICSTSRAGSTIWQLALRRRMAEKAWEDRDVGVWYWQFALDSLQLLLAKILFHDSFALSFIHPHALCGTMRYIALRITRSPSSQTTGDLIALSTHFHPWYRESP